ncbi:exported hypothetical protein [Vibrio coralliirubri]|nr:exported hypothetical protein [Vibrio coralliirubri]
MFFNKIGHFYNRVNTVISLRTLLSISVSMLSFFHPTTRANNSPMFVYAQSLIHSNVLQHKLAVEALMIENIRNMDNSTDIGFTLGLLFSI